LKRDYYEILGVERSAGPDELRKAYRRLAHQYHPDKNPDDPRAAEQFKEASEAYAVLSDPEKRATFDRFGHEGIMGSGGDPFAGFDPFSSFSDLFNEFFGGDLFGRGRRGRTGRRGADLRYDLDVEFEVAALGGERSIRVPKHTTCEACGGIGGERDLCQRCNGHGQVHLQQGFFRISRACDACGGGGQSLRNACPSCRGSGRVESVQTLSVRIPAGVDSGVRLRLGGEGEAGYEGGPPGDLYVVLQVHPHALFEREGSHLLLEVPISIAQAALGCDVEVPTLEGKEKIHVAPGTQSGETTVLRGKGLPRLGGGPRGDQHVRIFVEIPSKLTEEQRHLLEEFARVSGADVTPRRRGFLEKLKELFE
jgi:molecular chaperone DnaJ